MNKFLLALSILIICISSCKKMNTDETTITSLKQLVVDNNFTWNTSKDVELTIKNAQRGVVRIASEDESLLYSKLFSADPSVDLSVKITLPVSISKLSVNGTIVSVTSENLTVQLSALKSAVTTNFSMSYNGSTDWIKIPLTAGISFTNTMSMEAWVKATRQQTAKILQKGDWDGFGLGQDLWNGWQAGMALSDGTSVLANWGAGRPELNHWYHLAATYNGSNFKLYVDGIEMKNIAVSQNIRTNTRTISIGADNGNQKFFQGQLDDPSIWNIALTPTQVTNSFHTPWVGNESGLTGLWHFNEGSGSIALDSSPHLYNGTIFGATYNTEVGYNPLSDADGDGVQNSYDDFPEDATRAFINLTPAAGFGSLAFEDLWPSSGDYDFNDLVVDYQFKTITNASNKLVETFSVFILRASGAAFSNGFGFQLATDNIPASAITAAGTHLSESFITLAANGLESQQNKPTVIVFDNAFDLVTPPGGGPGFNTSYGAPYVAPDTITIHLVFTPNSYTIGQLDIGNFNPFMIVNKVRGKEVHLSNHPPTSLADITFFGQKDDSSNPATGRYYKTVNNLPWAINIAEPFAYPYEHADILPAYYHLAAWAQSNGVNFPDWYSNLPGYRNEALIYSHTP